MCPRNQKTDRWQPRSRWRPKQGGRPRYDLQRVMYPGPRSSLIATLTIGAWHKQLEDCPASLQRLAKLKWLFRIAASERRLFGRSDPVATVTVQENASPLSGHKKPRAQRCGACCFVEESTPVPARYQSRAADRKAFRALAAGQEASHILEFGVESRCRDNRPKQVAHASNSRTAAAQCKLAEGRSSGVAQRRHRITCRPQGLR